MAVSNDRAVEIILEILAETELSLQNADADANRHANNVARLTKRRDELQTARVADSSAREAAISAALEAENIDDTTRDTLVAALAVNDSSKLDNAAAKLTEAETNRFRVDEQRTAIVERRRVLRRVLKFLAKGLKKSGMANKRGA